MMFLKTRQKYGNADYPLWVDANDSIRGMIKAYPSNAGQGSLIEQAENLLSKTFCQDVYKASYTAFRVVFPTDLEMLMVNNLPSEIKQLYGYGYQ